MSSILLLSLMAFANVCSGVCAELIFDMSLANTVSICTKGGLRFLLAYFVNGNLRRWQSHLEARLVAVFNIWLDSDSDGWSEGARKGVYGLAASVKALGREAY